MYVNEKISIKYWSEDDRPREKLVQKGKHVLSDAELLAIIIGSGNAEASAVELSKQILNSVQNNLNLLGKLTFKDLTRFKGIGEAKAVSILAALELGKRRKSVDEPESNLIKSSEDIFNYIKNDICDLKHEEFWLICLKRNNKIISKRRISSGGLSQSIVDPKVLFNVALQELASNIIICHNHPSGNLKPSEHDREITKKLQKSAKLLDITLLDHLIITEKNYFSFADNDMLSF